MSTDRGTYALLLHLRQPQRIGVGRLGSLFFPAGYYVYIGSALAGLRHRLGRHLKQGKVLRWHVDYLREVAEFEEAWVAFGDERLECRWMETVAGWPEAQLVALGFGSSDCRCRAHLAYFAQKPKLGSLGARPYLPPSAPSPQ